MEIMSLINNRKSTFITPQRFECFRYKNDGADPRSRVWLVFFLGYVVEVIRPIVEHLGDDEGTFPSRSKLVRSFLIHSEYKVSFLEGSTPDITGMESTQILLIDGRTDQSHLTFLF